MTCTSEQGVHGDLLWTIFEGDPFCSRRVASFADEAEARQYLKDHIPKPVLDENQRPSKPLLPVWGDYSTAARDATREAAQNPPPRRHRAANGGWSEYQMLMDAVWPDRGRDVTFTDVLQRAREQRRLAEEHLDELMAAIENGR